MVSIFGVVFRARWVWPAMLVVSTSFVGAESIAQGNVEESVGRSRILIRALDGTWPQEAISQAETMSHRVSEASRKDELILWVTLGVPFNPDFDALTDEEIKSQQRSVEEMAVNVMRPFIEAGVARYYDNQLDVHGQGFRAVVSPSVLRELMSDPIIIQIVDET